MAIMQSIKNFFARRRADKFRYYKNLIKRHNQEWTEKLGRAPLFWRSDHCIALHKLQDRVKRAWLPVADKEKLLNLLH